MKCFCGNEFTKITIHKDEFLSCNSCGYLRKINILSSKEEKERYDLHICDDGYLKYMENVYLKIKPYIKGVSLDFGCGKIHALADLINHDFLCYYYDLYYHPNMPQMHFDTIILIEVFEHILDIYNLMLELKNSLNPNGRIIIMTKKKKYPLDTWWYIRDTTHVSFVDDKTMEILASRIDMKVQVLDGFYVFDLN